MSFDRERLLELLPAIYRRRDEEGDGTLSALLGIFARQAEALAEDLSQLYDDQFIETCAEWVVPYIADLVGARGVVSVQEAGFSARAYAANTIRYRRRKGTIAVVEQLARDVTGWPASAVEFFTRLIWSQNMNHIRSGDAATVDLRDWKALERLNGAFESNDHTVDVRRIATGRGKYNIPNIGIFLWRLQPYSLTASPAVAVSNRQFVIHPLGIDAPLITNPATETDIEHLAEPRNVPLPISRRVLDDALTNEVGAFYGSDRDDSILIRKGNVIVPVTDVDVCDLSDANHAWTTQPGRPVAIDPVLGRIALAAPTNDPISVTFHYAFPADVGGGEYERESSFVLRDLPVKKVPADFATIAAALTSLGGASGIVEITDSGRYAETFNITLSDHQRLELRANNGRRPSLVLGADCTMTGGEGAQLFLNGLLVSGGGLVVPADGNNKLGLLQLAHCTLVPGQSLARDGSPLRPDLPSIRVDAPNDDLELVLNRSITGPLHVSGTAAGVEATDSIVDGLPRNGWPALVSGVLAAPVNVSGGAPAVKVTIGSIGPLAVTIPASATYTPTQLRDALQNAIRNAHASAGFKQARVLTDGFRLVILPGTNETLAVQKNAADTTFETLKLQQGERRVVRVVISDRLPDPINFAAVNPRISIRIGGGTFKQLTLTDGTFANVRGGLEAAIQAVGGAPYADALVLADGNRFIVVPGTESEIELATADASTLSELGLATRHEAIRGPSAGAPCAPLSLTRCTIFGVVLANELPFVTDSIFTLPVQSKKKQTGCVRFSFVPDGSRTPRRYRCQPDLAVSDEIARREQLNIVVTPADELLIRSQIASWLVPSFVSTRYPDAAYAQLARATPRQIRTGSEDGSEMGVYEHLKQPQRESNLRAALDEYLRFGLEAGIFYAT
jgi:hypothetical protein